MYFTIRPCREEDAPFLYTLNRDEMGYDFPAEETAQNLKRLLDDPRSKIYVAVVDEQVVGYIHAADYDLLYAPHMKNILGIAVVKRYRNCGIGRALLQAVESWSGDTGASAVRLVSSESRTGAHAFYRSCGYSNEKTQLNFKKPL